MFNKNSMAMHTFVTGSTGSGKSNTIYEIIRQNDNLGLGYMIIEPAKGEYKHIFGNKPDVRVLGSNPDYSELLKINPFRFPKEFISWNISIDWLKFLTCVGQCMQQCLR